MTHRIEAAARNGRAYAPEIVSRRDALKLGGALLAGAALPLRHSTATVGDPRRPTALAAEIINAYSRGERDITITPGAYVLPATGKNSIELKGWQDTTVHCKGVTIIFEDTVHRPILLSGCSNVIIEDATLQFADISYTQGRIKAVAEDTRGKYVEWRIDVGYRTDIDPSRVTYNVIDQKTRLLKVGTGDSGAKEVITIHPGHYRLYQIAGLMGGALVNDWLVCRAKGGSSIVQLDQSERCTMGRITLKNAGFAAFFETGGEGGHQYFGCKIARGPRPAGATEEQLVSCGADGFHSTGTKTGPTIDHCIWEGVLLDDCIAVHGSFQEVIRAEGNKLILESGNRAGFAVNEPVRMSSSNGFFDEATCIALRTLDAPNAYLELTLDKALIPPADSKAGNPDRSGKFYRITNCILGNTRSRGILVKADNGLIQGCHIEGCGMSAVSIGPEYFWSEANYCWNVTVTENSFRENALRNNVKADGVIFVHGDGAIGNRNIAIMNNLFDGNYSPFLMNIGWSNIVEISNNNVTVSANLPSAEPSCIIKLHDLRNVALRGNTYALTRPSVLRAIDVGANVEALTGNDDAGIRLVKR